MPLTSSVPFEGCCRSAITRKIVVLPQPDGPMNETNSPSAICRLTLESASTFPSAVSKVREISCASTTSLLGEGSGAIVNAESTVAGDDGSSSGRSLTVGSLAIDMLDIRDAIWRYWQMQQSVARLLFMHAERIISSDSLFFDAIAVLFPAGAFDLHRLRKLVLRLRTRGVSREHHQACASQIHCGFVSRSCALGQCRIR